MKSGKFLQRVPLERARELVRSLARVTESEDVATEDALGRFTAQSVFARFASPHYRASAMDGIAVRAADTSRASAEAPLELDEVDELQESGGASEGSGAKGCIAVDTGNPLPVWTDAVIRIEDTKREGGRYRIVQPVSAGKDIREIGEDVAAGALLFGPGHRIRPYDIGALLATGVDSVPVRRLPRVAVFATGTEIVEPGGDPGPGQVIEFNSRMLTALVSQWGGIGSYGGHIDDEPEALERALLESVAGSDAVCVIAGSSAGRKDYTVDILAKAGTLHAHGVDMMPGKPAAIAEVGGVPVIGIPGYPVSAYAVYRELVQALVCRSLGSIPDPVRTLPATVRRRIVSRLGVEELLRVCLIKDHRGLSVAALPRGAGSVTTLVRADAILRIPATCEGHDAGEEVTVELLETGTEPGATWVIAGKPDPLSARLESELRSTGSGLRVSYLGRTGYDMVAALESGEAHTAIVSVADPGAAQNFEALVAEHARGAEVINRTDGFVAALGNALALLPEASAIRQGLTAED